MAYINWMDFVNNTISKPVTNLPDGHIKWTDRVTGTKNYINSQDYKAYFERIKKEVDGKAPELIIKFLDNHDRKQDYIETFPFKVPSGNSTCTLREAARLYVLFAYLIYQPTDNEKQEFRKSAYRSFFSCTNKNPLAWDALEYMVSGRGNFRSELEVTVLKGGAYKIKKYYLENNEIKDIRGASALLTYVGEKLIPGDISNRFIEECIIYSGGGSVFCILPGEVEENLWYEAEMKFHEYTLSANSAFCQDKVRLSEILKNYKATIRSIDDKIEQRKRMKVYNSTCPESSFMKIGKLHLDEMEVNLEVNLETYEEKIATCKLCGVRIAKYKLKIGNKENVCGSCLHKHLVGKQDKNKYFEEYESFVNRKLGKPLESINDIAGKDKNKYIAVVYADGNNMGAILHTMNRLDAVMYFSRRTSSAAKKATFGALQEVYGGSREGSFEIIAIGGDDIFVFVPAKDSIEFSTRLVKLFNKEFRNLTASDSENVYGATLSAGVCIGNSKTSVRVMFDAGEKAMKRAKVLARSRMEENCDNGSIEFVILQSSVGTASETKSRNFEEESVKTSLLPYTSEVADGMIKLVKKMRAKENNIGKSNLFRIAQGFDNVESIKEAKLFYCYDQARNGKKLEKVLYNSRIDGFTPESGFFKDERSGKLYSPWRDILDLWDFCGGEADE